MNLMSISIQSALIGFVDVELLVLVGAHRDLNFCSITLCRVFLLLFLVVCFFDIVFMFLFCFFFFLFFLYILKMIEIKYRDHWVKKKIPAWYNSPNYLFNYVSKIEPLKCPYDRWYFFSIFCLLLHVFIFPDLIKN